MQFTHIALASFCVLSVSLVISAPAPKHDPLAEVHGAESIESAFMTWNNNKEQIIAQQLANDMRRTGSASSSGSSSASSSGSSGSSSSSSGSASSSASSSGNSGSASSSASASSTGGKGTGGTPTPPTPAPVSPTAAPTAVITNHAATITQVITLSITASQYNSGLIKQLFEQAYGLGLTIFSTTSGWETGCSVTSTAARRSATVTMTAKVSSAKQSAATSASQSLTETTLTTHMNTVKSSNSAYSSVTLPTVSNVADPTVVDNNTTSGVGTIRSLSMFTILGVAAAILYQR